MGVIIWLEAIWPDLIPADIRFFTLAVFGGILFLSIRAAIEEVISRRRLKRYIASKKGVTLKDTPDSLEAFFHWQSYAFQPIFEA